MHPRQKLIDDIRTLDIRHGDTLMIHASMRAVRADALTLLEAFHAAAGREGTIMMYIGCDGPYDDVGRGHLSPAEEAAILRDLPPCHPGIRANPEHGILAEIFRQQPDVIISHNPGARMAATGAKATFLMEDHPLHYGYGPGSPLGKLYDLDGKIVHVGSDLDNTTLLHYAEHVAPVEGKRIVCVKTPYRNAEGGRLWTDVEEYDTCHGIRRWPDGFFRRIVEEHIAQAGLKARKIGDAPSYAISARALVDYAIPTIVEKAGKYPS